MGLLRQKFDQFRVWSSGQRQLQWLKPMWRPFRKTYGYVAGEGSVARAVIDWLEAMVRGHFLTRLFSATPKRLRKCSKIFVRSSGKLAAVAGFMLRPCVTLVALIVGPPLLYCWLRHRCSRSISREASTPDSLLVVLLVCSQKPLGGHVTREARLLVKAGFRVTIICPEWAPAIPPPSLGPAVQIKVVPRCHGIRPSDTLWRIGIPLLDAAIEERPWAYVAQGFAGFLPALTAAAEHRVHCLCSLPSRAFRDGNANSSRSSLYSRWVNWLIHRLTANSAAAVVHHGGNAASELQRRYRQTGDSRPINVRELDSGMELGDRLRRCPMPCAAPRIPRPRTTSARNRRNGLLQTARGDKNATFPGKRFDGQMSRTNAKTCCPLRGTMGRIPTNCCEWTTSKGKHRVSEHGRCEGAIGKPRLVTPRGIRHARLNRKGNHACGFFTAPSPSATNRGFCPDTSALSVRKATWLCVTERICIILLTAFCLTRQDPALAAGSDVSISV